MILNIQKKLAMGIVRSVLQRARKGMMNEQNINFEDSETALNST